MMRYILSTILILMVGLCARAEVAGLTPIDVPGACEWSEAGLAGKYIALWPSHGTYYNASQDLWRWQRATMWTTVEDVYTTEYMRLITRMLENAGAVVFQPRPRIGGRDLKRHNGKWVYREDGDAMLTGRSGMPRWCECAREWLEWAGYPDSIYHNFENNHYKDDMVARGRWVNYLIGGSARSPRTKGLGIPIDVCLALHTDGINSPGHRTTVGTVAIYYTTGQSGHHSYGDGRLREVSHTLSRIVEDQLVHDIRATFAPEWNNRGLRDANYAESRIPEVPTVLLELLSHKNMADMRLGLDPRFRFTASRAIYKGLLRYLHGDDGISPVIQPLPVEGCRTELVGGDSIRLSWQAQKDEIEPTAEPTYYIVYIRENDGNWQPVSTDEPNYTHRARRGVRYDYYVVAGNEGGVSMPGERVSACKAPHHMKRQDKVVMLINAFNTTCGPEWFCDSTYMGIIPGSYAVEDGMSVAYIGNQTGYDKRIDWKDDDNCGVGACSRQYQGQIVVGNTHDYCAERGRVLAEMGYSYVSCNVTALDSIPVGIHAVEVIAGKQRSEMFTPALQQQLGAYVKHGGRLLISGSYIGSSLTTKADREWADHTLHYKYRAPKASYNGNIQAEHAALGRHPIHIAQQPNPIQIFAEAPESLNPTGKAERVGLYSDTRIPCGTIWDNRVIAIGFPIECVYEWQQLYRALMSYLM